MKIFKCTGLSDTHTYHRKLTLDGGDFLFCTGDISWFGQPEEVYDFIDWYAEQDYRYKVFIAGNHDWGFEPEGVGVQSNENGTFWFRGKEWLKALDAQYTEYARLKGVHYLDKEEVVLDGVKIYGIPNQPAFCGWAFNYYTPDEAEEIFSKIPEDTDVLLTHAPPKGVRDYIHPSRVLDGDTRYGCPVNKKHVFRVKPQVHIFGHIHGGYGVEEIDGIKFINAAICDDTYRNLMVPINFEIEK